MKRICGLAALIAVGVLFSTGQIIAQSGDSGYVVVANKQLPGSSIKTAVLKGIYLREMRNWGNNRGEIVPVDLTNCDDFYQNLFGKTRVQMQVYWMNMRIKYSVELPVSKKDSESVKQFIADNAGAIGFIKSSDVDDRVKVLKVID
jgi:ABC-type phosphate transport system substrate-binding protein